MSYRSVKRDTRGPIVMDVLMFALSPDKMEIGTELQAKWFVKQIGGFSLFRGS